MSHRHGRSETNERCLVRDQVVRRGKARTTKESMGRGKYDRASFEHAQDAHETKETTLNL
jgi:hypothetical protein